MFLFLQLFDRRAEEKKQILRLLCAQLRMTALNGKSGLLQVVDFGH
jgi:hypothetical protein